MRKNVLALSIAALVGGLGLAGGASAGVFGEAGRTADTLQVNTDGLGHILLVPYFTAANDTITIVNVVNTDTVNGKAVKVRFRGAANSDDVFDFQLFLSPGDVYSGAVVKSGAGATLQSADNSCTLPYEVRGGGGTTPTVSNFVSTRLGAAGARGTLEGYVEILNMADVPPASALFTATKHLADGTVPCTTAVLDTLTVDPTDVPTPAGGPAVAALFANPTTGLMANWTIINVANVASWGGAATAIEARDGLNGPSAAGNIVFSPQTAQVATTLDLENTSDPLIVQGLLPASALAAKYDFPDLSTPYVTAQAPGAAATQANFLTGSLAVTSVTNEFITSDSVAGSTDWVFSMPTRRYSVALDYATGLAVFTTPGLPGNYFSTANIAIDSSTTRIAQAGEKVICAYVPPTNLRYFNRSELTPGASRPPFVISPGIPSVAGNLTFCGEASVLAFNLNDSAVTVSEVLGASIGMNQLNLPGYAEGWATINTTTAAHPLGLPILGAAFQRFLNVGANNNVQGNFGSVWTHRNTRITQTP